VPLERFSLAGRVALVTGASRNIGASLAEGLAAAGAEVIGVARTGAELDERVAAIAPRTGQPVHGIVADVGSATAVDALVDEVSGRFGAIDILVNNAFAHGRSFGLDILDVGEDAWDEAWRVNVLGPWRLITRLAPAMRARGWGSVINVVSGSGFLPTPGFVAYGATKAALWQMTRYLAVELAPTVRVNALCPGLVNDTGAPRSEAEARVIDQIPMGRLGHPDELQGAAVYLASDASSYTTGEVIFCNGGRPW
jgi:NAD(P)-dependent dehydrogenase (short-subunit alcohol dehydrogenase family)